MNARTLSQDILDDRTGLAEIHLAGIARLQFAHALAHIAKPLRAGLLDNFAAARLDILVTHLGGQKIGNHLNFQLFLVGPFLAVYGAGFLFIGTLTLCHQYGAGLGRPVLPLTEAPA